LQIDTDKRRTFGAGGGTFSVTPAAPLATPHAQHFALASLDYLDLGHDVFNAALVVA